MLYATLRVAWELKRPIQEVRNMKLDEFCDWVGFFLLKDEVEAAKNKTRGF